MMDIETIYGNPRSAVNMGKRIALLIKGGDVTTCDEIGPLISLHPVSVKAYMAALVKAGVIHITRHGRSSGGGSVPSQFAAYAFGPTPDGFGPTNTPRRQPVMRSEPKKKLQLSSDGEAVVRLVKARNTGEFKRGEMETYLFGGAK